MFGVASFFLILTIFQIARSEMPEHCKRPPPGTDHEECCTLPEMFKKEDLEECGIKIDGPKVFGKPGDCSKYFCILKKNDLMKDETTIDKAAVNDFLDKWVEGNAEYKDVIAKSKARCLDADLPGPPEVCEPKKVGFCMMITAFENCPNWKDSEVCKKVKEHMDECKSYLPF